MPPFRTVGMVQCTRHTQHNRVLSICSFITLKYISLIAYFISSNVYFQIAHFRPVTIAMWYYYYFYNYNNYNYRRYHRDHYHYLTLPFNRL